MVAGGGANFYEHPARQDAVGHWMAFLRFLRGGEPSVE
jgi:hypothetical protein